jgi:ubiquitin carboxyl-terminal hydrolase 36/42
MKCGYPSDTFDSILDLSLDVQNCNSLLQALKEFVAVDHLRGEDKYKCEKYAGLACSVALGF